MHPRETQCLLLILFISASLLSGCAWLSGEDSATPDGLWTCSAQWSYERDGVVVPVVVSMENLCEENMLSSEGQVEIGDAKWTEWKKGTCYASGDELYGKWTSSKTTAANDAAKKFEEEVLEGKRLGDTSTNSNKEYRVRVTSRTDNTFDFVNEDGRNVTCNRL